MLSRIYATAFAKKDELDAYLKQLEEAERRDHRKLAREMDLFHFQEEGPGSIFWHPKGWTLFQTLVAYMRRRLAADYEEVNAPQVLDKHLWEISGHWGWYRESMFMCRPAGEDAEDEDERIYCAQADELPGPCADLQERPALAIANCRCASPNSASSSLRALGRAARRDAGARLHPGRRAYLLHRGAARRGMPQDQRVDPLGLRPFRLRQDRGQALDPARQARRDGRHVGPRRSGDEPRARRDQGAPRQCRDDELNPGEGAFYGPKFEYVLRDAIGRDWQCGTTQVDFNLPERFGAFYIAPNSEKTTPVMVHRAICGSMERFIGILLEHYAGHLPLWLAPVQIVVCTITSDGDEFALRIRGDGAEARACASRRICATRRSTTRCASTRWPRSRCCSRSAARKRASNTVSVRRLGSNAQTVDGRRRGDRGAGGRSDAARFAGRADKPMKVPKVEMARAAARKGRRSAEPLTNGLQASAMRKARLDAVRASWNGYPLLSADAARSRDFLHDESRLPEGEGDFAATDIIPALPKR